MFISKREIIEVKVLNSFIAENVKPEEENINSLRIVIFIIQKDKNNGTTSEEKLANEEQT